MRQTAPLQQHGDNVIETIKLDDKFRDDIATWLKGLQHLYTQSSVRAPDQQDKHLLIFSLVYTI